MARKLFLFYICVLIGFGLYSQTNNPTGQDTTYRPITTAVAFLGFAPDTRSSGMGLTGVATSPDAASTHWNNAKLIFAEKPYALAISYAPWLGNLVDDMSISYVSGYYKISDVQAVAGSFRFFNLGQIQLRDENAQLIGLESPQELAFDGSYSRKLSEKLGLGVSARFIYSNLTSQANTNSDGKAGTSVAIDLGVYYAKDLLIGGRDTKWALGALISNIGQKISYLNEDSEDFIPGNLRVGSSIKTSLDPYNTLTIALDANKLLVPSPITDENGSLTSPDKSLLSGTFGSFGDAQGGFSEELKEISLSTGAEYWYKDLFAVRAGYFWEHYTKGGRQILSIGTGIRYQVFGLDFSYWVPFEQNNPLAETLRFTLVFNFNENQSKS